MPGGRPGAGVGRFPPRDRWDVSAVPRRGLGERAGGWLRRTGGYDGVFSDGGRWNAGGGVPGARVVSGVFVETAGPGRPARAPWGSDSPSSDMDGGVFEKKRREAGRRGGDTAPAGVTRRGTRTAPEASPPGAIGTRCEGILGNWTGCSCLVLASRRTESCVGATARAGRGRGGGNPACREAGAADSNLYGMDARILMVIIGKFGRGPAQRCRGGSLPQGNGGGKPWVLGGAGDGVFWF